MAAGAKVSFERFLSDRATKAAAEENMELADYTATSWVKLFDPIASHGIAGEGEGGGGGAMKGAIYYWNAATGKTLPPGSVEPAECLERTEEPLADVTVRLQVNGGG